ncbi:MAG: VWA domain-containing protein [Chitinispirillaceae bacterium]|jgi:hypothetical protein
MRGKRAGRDVLRVVVLVILVMTIGNSSAQRVAEFCFRGTPELLNNRTVYVSDTMAALSGMFFAKTRRDTTIITSETPSIFITIDNSGSMSGASGNDPSGLRFSIASAYIDSMRAKFPSVEVGMAVFGTHLYFDPGDRPYFATCGAQAEGAYVPLLKLDSVYSAYGNQTGYQILKSLLAVSTYDTGANQYVGLTYQPTDMALRGQGCNITAGFDAVKCAMASAKASRCSQYVIFLSDGEANAPGGAATWYFRDSVKNDPTTFTVFFPGTATLQNSPGLREIDTMTRNIRVNGYDLSEPPDSGCTQRSNYWSCNSPLNYIVIDNMWSIIVMPSQTQPEQITVNGQTATMRSGDTAFVFNELIPLTGQITPVNVSLMYRFYKNNVLVGDTMLYINYNIQTLPHGSSAWNPTRDSFDIWTWDRALSFHYALGAIDTPVSYIAETMDSVELYFTFDSGTAKYGYDGAPGLGLPVNLYNKMPFSSGYAIDHEIVYLQRAAGNVFSAKFKRQVSGVANPGDGVLQYQGNNDSIIAVFRNSESDKVVLPLDTLRLAIALSPPSAISYDNKTKQRTDGMWSVSSANGRIRVRFPDNSAHAVKIFSLAGHCVESRVTGQDDVSFKLPKGVYIVTANAVGGSWQKRKMIINIER